MKEVRGYNQKSLGRKDVRNIAKCKHFRNLNDFRICSLYLAKCQEVKKFPHKKSLKSACTWHEKEILCNVIIKTCIMCIHSDYTYLECGSIKGEPSAGGGGSC